MFHPKLAQQLSLMWGSPELNLFLQKITMADGGANAVKLNGAELSELAALAVIHADLVPPPPDVWSKATRL